ncbi:MAG TPA: bestrophin family protein, partial [Polyangiaceae bacterium]|nr:bestrophin family protein [Polyangiaceae bacterium]
MIDYDAKGFIGIIFRLRGSVFPQLLPRILVVTGVGAVAAWVEQQSHFSIAPIAHTLIGVALGLLLVFRTNASYDRFWEGRKLLGGIVNRSRDLVRQAAVWLADEPAPQAEVRRLVVAMVALVHQRLRKETDLSKVAAWLSEDERKRLEPLGARAPVVATWLSQRLADRAQHGRLSEQRLQAMDANLTALLDAMGGAERIVKTPVPFAYAQHIKIFVTLFCLTVPFAMSSSLHWLTPAGAALLAFALFGIDEIGVEIEEPFGYDP